VRGRSALTTPAVRGSTRGVTPIVDRTSPTDLMQLAADLPGAPMQVAAVLVLGAAAGLDRAAVRAAIGRRIGAVPRLRQRLLPAPLGGGRPVWADDPDFDPGRHVDAVRCPAPGDEAALLGVVAGIVARRLPRDRPLWSATLVTSLPAGGTALVLVLHHVLADGLGGLAVLARLVDGAPAAPDLGPPRPPPDRRALLRDATAARLRAPARIPAQCRRLRSALAHLAAGGVAGPPRSSLNRPTGPGRALAVARADLAAVQRAAHDHGATVNDVVLTAVSGALYAVLRHRGEDADRFVLSVPVAGRREATAGHLGNQVGVLPVPVTVAGDLSHRLTAVARTTRAGKAAAGDSAALLTPVFRLLARLGAFRWCADRQRLVTTMVTNLRGPAARHTFLGAPITGILPVPPLTGNVTVGFAALSYAGTLVVTVIADPLRCPDLGLLRARLQRELDDLAAGATGRTTGAARPVPARPDR